MNNSKIELTLGSFWSFISITTPQLFNLLAYIIIAKSIGRIEFGYLGIITSTMVVFGNLAGLGFGKTATYVIANSDDYQNGKVSNIISSSLSISIIVAIVLIVILITFSDFFLISLLRAPQIKLEFLSGTALILSNVIFGVQVSIITGFKKFKKISYLSFLKAIITFAMIVTGVIVWGLEGVIISLAISTFIINYLAHLEILKICKEKGINFTLFTKKIDFDLFKNYSLPAFLLGIIIFPTQWIINLIIVNSKHGYSDLGLLNATNQFKNLLLFMPSIFASVSFPILASQNTTTNNVNNYNEIIEFNLDLTFLIIIPFSIILIYFSKELMHLYGKDYLEGTLLLKIIIVGVMFSAIGSPLGTAIQSKGRMWLGFQMNLVWSLISFIFLLALINTIGLNSYGIGFTLGHFVLLIWGVTYFYNLLAIKIRGKFLLYTFIIIYSSAFAFIELSIIPKLLICFSIL